MFGRKPSAASARRAGSPAGDVQLVRLSAAQSQLPAAATVVDPASQPKPHSIATKLLTAFIAASGFLLFASTLARILLQRAACIQEAGELVWQRASPAVYFANGLLGTTGCSY